MMSTHRTMFSFACAAAMLCAGGTGIASAEPANPRAQMVTSKPTTDSLTGLKHPVLYDDGKCPKGQIAQFSKKGGQAQMRRSCVDRPS